MPSSVRLPIAWLLAFWVCLAFPAQDVAARQSRPGGERSAGLAVDFVAAQPDGTPIVDLQPAEIEVRINGRNRTVRSIRLVSAAPAPRPADATAGLSAPFGSNTDVSGGRSFAIVFDQESFVTGREPLLRNAVEGLVGQLTAADRTAIIALPFGGVTLPFTADTARIRRAMESLSGQGSRNETGSDLACRTRRFLESLDGFLAAQAGGKSPLTVVLFTAGLAAPRRDAPMAHAPGMCELLPDQFRVITAAAGAARANFYVVQPADIGMTASRWSETISGINFLGSDNPLEGIEHLAGVTGAARLPLDASGSGSLLRVARETSAYWVAELETEPGEVFGRSRTLDVRVLRKDVTVRARPEITFAEPSRGAVAPRLAMSDLLASRDAFTDLSLRVGGFTVREADGRLRVGVVVETVDPGASLGSVGAVLVDANGQTAARWFAADALARPLLGAMGAARGSYRLRVVAIDSGGRIGAAEEDVDVGLTSVGPLSLGSLMLGLSRADGMSPKLQFSSEPTAIASFDIYGGTATTRLAATLEVARMPNGPALVTVPIALARATESRVVASGAVPIGALPPGDYAVRGVIRLEDGTIGRVVRTLRKVR